MYNEDRRKNESFLWRFLGQERRRFDYSQNADCNYGNIYTGLISKDPVFFDLGAFKGNWSQEMLSRFGGISHMFEIHPELLEKLNITFAKEDNAHVHPFGLGPKNEQIKLALYTDGEGFSLSRARQSGQDVCVEIKSFSDFVDENKIENIDVCKINIEGAEYDLLEKMIENKTHLKCKNIQVEFHRQYPIPDWFNRYNVIRAELLKTHVPTLDYYFSWQNWCRKDDV